MRILSILSAIAVAAALYLFVFERDLLTGGGNAAEPADPAVAAESAAEQDEGEVVDGIAVVALRSEAQTIDSAVQVRGQTEAARQVNVVAETTGQVISTPLRKGRLVEAGELMCELDPGTRAASLAEAKARLTEARATRAEADTRGPEAEARLAEARARLDEALVNQNAAKRLSEDGFASETRVKSADASVAAAESSVEAALSGLTGVQSGIQSAEAAIESAMAAVAAAEKEIERLQITAPFSGLLESDSAELGSLLQPGALCATVIQLNPIKLVAFVPEVDVDRVQIGAAVGARLASGREVIGEVTFLSRSADMTTRTFRVEAEVDNSDLSIRDGQTIEMLIAAEGRVAHLIPGSALTLDDNGTLGLRVIDDGKALFKPVSVLRDTVDGMWLSGLDEQEDVIVVGQEYVTDGVAVVPTFRETEG